MSCGRTWRAMGATVRSRTSMGLWWSWNSWEPAVVAQHPRPPWKWALRSLTSRKEHFDGVLLTNEFIEICDVFSIYVYSYLKKAGACTHRSGTEAWSLAQPYFLICQVGQENLCFSLASLLWLNSSDQCPTLKPGKRSKSEFQRLRRWWKSLLNRNRSPLRAWRRQAEAKMKCDELQRRHLRLSYLQWRHQTTSTFGSKKQAKHNKNLRVAFQVLNGIRPFLSVSGGSIEIFELGDADDPKVVLKMIGPPLKSMAATWQETLLGV